MIADIGDRVSLDKRVIIRHQRLDSMTMSTSGDSHSATLSQQVRQLLLIKLVLGLERSLLGVMPSLQDNVPGFFSIFNRSLAL